MDYDKDGHLDLSVGSSTGAYDSLAIGTDNALSPKLITDVRLGYDRQFRAVDAAAERAKETSLAPAN
jgi:hypothetical protein